eukprot:5594778-Pleurochrysis_carterae.AAC.1
MQRIHAKGSRCRSSRLRVSPSGARRTARRGRPRDGARSDLHAELKYRDSLDTHPRRSTRGTFAKAQCVRPGRFDNTASGADRGEDWGP